MFGKIAVEVQGLIKSAIDFDAAVFSSSDLFVCTVCYRKLIRFETDCKQPSCPSPRITRKLRKRRLKDQAVAERFDNAKHELHFTDLEWTIGYFRLSVTTIVLSERMLQAIYGYLAFIGCNTNGNPELAQKNCKIPRFLMVSHFPNVLLQGIIYILPFSFPGLG